MPCIQQRVGERRRPVEGGPRERDDRSLGTQQCAFIAPQRFLHPGGRQPARLLRSAQCRGNGSDVLGIEQDVDTGLERRNGGLRFGSSRERRFHDQRVAHHQAVESPRAQLADDRAVKASREGPDGSSAG